MSVLFTPWKSSRYSDFFSQTLHFPSKNNVIMKLRRQLGCTLNRWKSEWLLSCKSKATGKCVSFRELLPNLSQLYSSSQGLCETWDCQHTHNIITLLGLFAGGFGLFFFFSLFFSLLFSITCHEQVCKVKPSEVIKWQNYSYYAIQVCCQLLSYVWK